jgi:Helix-turn-helix domain
MDLHRNQQITSVTGQRISPGGIMHLHRTKRPEKWELGMDLMYVSTDTLQFIPDTSFTVFGISREELAMPWKECRKMDEKLKFVSRFLDGEKIAVLCREFGISRVTGHKIIDRYRESGLEAFTDRSRRPYRQANQLPFQVEKLILQLKQEWPNWGPRRLGSG